MPATIPLGQGFVAVQVVNTDTGFSSSNLGFALLQGNAAAGIPTIKTIDGKGLAATSSDPDFATNNVETVVPQGSLVKLGGTGFDTAHGVAIDLFCACPGGKIGPFFLNPGNAGLTSTELSFTLPTKANVAHRTGLVRGEQRGRHGLRVEEQRGVGPDRSSKIAVSSVSQP